MNTKLRDMRPSEAFQDAFRRSMAAGVGGFVFIGALHASGAFANGDRGLLAIVSGTETFFFSTLIFTLAYFHRRWLLGSCGVILSLVLPFSANSAWVKLSGHPLIYSVVAGLILGGVAVEMTHRKISGPQYEDDIDEEAIKQLIENIDANVTWIDTVTLLCFTVGAVLLLVLLFR